MQCGYRNWLKMSKIKIFVGQVMASDFVHFILVHFICNPHSTPDFNGLKPYLIICVITISHHMGIGIYLLIIMADKNMTNTTKLLNAHANSPLVLSFFVLFQLFVFSFSLFLFLFCHSDYFNEPIEFLFPFQFSTFSA